MNRAWKEAVLFVRLAHCQLAIAANTHRRDKAIIDLSKAITARDAAMAELQIFFHEGPVEVQVPDRPQQPQVRTLHLPRQPQFKSPS